MKLSDEALRNLFDALELNGALSYQSVATALGVSLMTVHRIAHELLQQRKLSARHGIDPKTQRRMTLLTLPHAPRCLILDMQHSALDTRAYYGNGSTVESLRGTYHSASQQDDAIQLNADNLTKNASLLWRDADLAHVVLWSQGCRRAAPSSRHTDICPLKKSALLYLLSRHPVFSNKKSLLFLHMGDLPYGLYLEKSNTSPVWNEPTGEMLLTARLRTLGWQSHLPSDEKSILMAKFLNYISTVGLYHSTPQMMIVEEDGLQSKGKPLGLPLSFDATHATLYRHTSDIPLWAYGGLWQWRREAWLSSFKHESITE